MFLDKHWNVIELIVEIGMTLLKINLSTNRAEVVLLTLRQDNRYPPTLPFPPAALCCILLVPIYLYTRVEIDKVEESFFSKETVQ